jgi:lysophospholipase L1-like esterase
MSRSPLLLSLVLIGSAASHAQAAAQGHNSSTKRHLQQVGLLPDPISNNPPSQQPSNSSTAPTCWGWKSTQCLTSGTDLPAFALLGDSITDCGFRSYGWASLLAAAYGDAVNMVNYGIPGATTRKVDILFEKFIQQWGSQLQQVKLVAICFGANDAVKPHAPLWHLPIPTFKENLQRLVSRLQERGITRIVLVTPPPVGQRNDRDNALTATYAAAVIELAKELQLESVDVYSGIMAVDQWKVSKAVRHSRLGEQTCSIPRQCSACFGSKCTSLTGRKLSFGHGLAPTRPHACMHTPASMLEVSNVGSFTNPSKQRLCLCAAACRMKPLRVTNCTCQVWAIRCSLTVFCSC